MKENFKRNLLQQIKSKKFILICIYIFICGFLSGNVEAGNNFFKIIERMISIVTYVYLGLFISSFLTTTLAYDCIKKDQFILMHYNKRKDYAKYIIKNILISYTVVFFVFLIINFISAVVINFKGFIFEKEIIIYIIKKYIFLYEVGLIFSFIYVLLEGIFKDSKKNIIITFVLIFISYIGFYMSPRNFLKYFLIYFNMQNCTIYSLCYYLILNIILITATYIVYKRRDY